MEVHGDLPPNPPYAQEKYMVRLAVDDIYNPFAWSGRKKAITSAIAIIANFNSIFASAILSPGGSEIASDFHVGSVVATLSGVSLYVAGFASGPIFWGPLSEILGRKVPLALSEFLLMCFSFAVATCKDIQTLAVCRFFSGISGSAALVLAPAAIGDMFPTKTRGKVQTLSVTSFMLGPSLAPIIGSYISSSYLRWRWTMYLDGILSAAILILLIFFLPETFAPVLVRDKAMLLRVETGIWPLYAPIEREQIDLGHVARRVLLRPFSLLITEPILLLMSLYIGFIYGIQYLCLGVVPFIFENYGWKGGNAYLPYIGVLLGNFAIGTINVFVFDSYYHRGLVARRQKMWPEGRLPAMVCTSVSLPVGIFLLTWSGNYQVHWIVPTIGLFFIGVGLSGMYMGGFNYIVETYLSVSASAMAANTFMRSGMGCAFPLFAVIMFENLGTNWAGTVLGCLAAFFAPVPIIFFLFGHKIRRWSKNTVKDEDVELAIEESKEDGEVITAE